MKIRIVNARAMFKKRHVDDGSTSHIFRMVHEESHRGKGVVINVKDAEERTKLYWRLYTYNRAHNLGCDVMIKGEEIGIRATF